MTTVPSNDDRHWLKSSYTADGKDCVEITMDVVDGTQDIGDTKNHGGPTLTFPRAGIVRLLAHIKDGSIR